MAITERDQAILDAVRDTDEPIIIFRAQDRFSATIAGYYYQQCAGAVADPPSKEFTSKVAEKVDELNAWQVNNPEKVKTPDLKEGEV